MKRKITYIILIALFVFCWKPALKAQKIEDLGKIAINSTPSANEIYIKTTTLPGTSIHTEQITYYTGLGSPKQVVNVAASPNGEDLIQHVYYDEYGRTTREYLPYTDEGNGEYRKTVEQDVADFYKSDIKGKDKQYDNPYSITVLENSPLNRKMSAAGPGTDWHLHPVKFEYLSNESEISSWDENGNSKTYAANSLYVTQITDEDGNVSREYKDILGQVVLKESENGEELLQTFYIYDKHGLLRTVVPPLAASPAQKELCYFYEYDSRKRMISKKLPGAQIVYMVYDKRDRLVLTQDGNLRNDGDDTHETFMFTKYDALNRPVMTGKIKISTTIDHIRDRFNESDYTPYENYNGTGIYAYSLNESYPSRYTISEDDVETVSYYDSYNFINDLDLTNDLKYHTVDLYEGFKLEYSDAVKGLPTGTMVKVYDNIESSYSLEKDRLFGVSYYDEYGNVIQTISQNHLGGTDILSSRYEDLSFLLLQTQQQHINDGNLLVKILESYTYDHMGRLLETRYKLNDEDEIILSSVKYNELGEMIEKKLHSKDGINFAQKIDYTYNIRSWLTKINDPDILDDDLFGMNLYYNNIDEFENISAQYNGNIAAMTWNTVNDTNRGYSFNYDALNRLKKANYGEGNTLAANKDLFSMNADYDKNGNILLLNRNFRSTDDYADQLTYSYYSGTNQLQKVTDPTGDVAGVEDYAASTSANYLYDSNGNMTYDPGKDILVEYNTLNLPKKVGDATGTEKIFYFYDASGRKLAKSYENSTSSVDNTTEYLGNIVYENHDLAYIITSEGRLVPIIENSDSTRQFEYNLKDHLGNSRVSFAISLTSDSLRLLQQSHYYPFGLAFKQENYTDSLIDYAKNNYLYNGKELQEEKLAGRSLNWYDYGARFYDPALGRWFVIDPMAELGRRWSQYNYAWNNPLRFIDPDGMWPDEPSIFRSTPDNPSYYSSIDVSRTSTSITVSKTSYISASETQTNNFTIKSSSKNISNISDKSARVVSVSMEKVGDNEVSVSSTTRTPEAQASVMYDNVAVKGFDATKGMYKNPGQEVMDVYDNYSPEWNCSKSETTEKMTEKINELGSTNVSKHCADASVCNVFDISFSSVENPTEFHKALKGNSGIDKSITPYDKEGEQAFHIQINQ